MREYGIQYDLNGRMVYEIFAVCSSKVLCVEIDAIKAKSGYIVAVDCIN